MTGGKPIVGVMPLYDTQKDSIWMFPGYLDGLYEMGMIPLIFPLNIHENDAAHLYALCDGILLTGGQDVDPQLYGEERRPCCGEINSDRDLLEKGIFFRAYKDNKPLLGICRGLQLMNVLLEGSVYQDIKTEMQADFKLEHRMQPPYDRFAHQIKIVKNTPLFSVLGQTKVGVNSYHHQGVKRAGKNLIPMAYATDGLVEAVCCKRKKFMWGIQWHPEFSYMTDANSRKIFKAFADAMKK